MRNGADLSAPHKQDVSSVGHDLCVVPWERVSYGNQGN